MDSLPASTIPIPIRGLPSRGPPPIKEKEEEEPWWKRPRPIQFRMGWSTIRGDAYAANEFCPHVLKVTVHSGPWHHFVAAVLSWLPSPLQHLVRRLWPRYALPDCVIVKKLRKAEHRDAFESEQVTYRRLEALQGDLIPRFYGEALVQEGNDDDDDDDDDYDYDYDYDYGGNDSRRYHGPGTRAWVISFFPWPILLDQPEPILNVDDFQARIEVAVDAMLQQGVVYGDVKMDNIMLRDDGRIVFIDLEMAMDPEPGMEIVDRWFTVMAFVDQYKRYLRIRAQERGEPAPPAHFVNKPPPEVQALLPPQNHLPANIPPPMSPFLPDGRPRPILPATRTQIESMTPTLSSSQSNQNKSFESPCKEQVSGERNPSSKGNSSNVQETGARIV